MTENETLQTGEIIEREEIATSKPRRKPGRPRKTESADVTFDGTSTESKPRRGRRSSKLTGENVADMISLSSDMVAMGTGHIHWHIERSECAGFAPQMADLLNRIPAKYVKAFVDMNGYVIIGYGLYSVLSPRIAEEQRLRHIERAERLRSQEGVPVYGPPKPGDFMENVG